VAVVCALLAVILVETFGVGTGTAHASDTAHVSTTGHAKVQHVVLVGVPGLRWADVTASGTPALWRLAEHSADGSLSDRTVDPRTCPLDGWLTIGSGARSAAPRDTGSQGTTCPAVPTPRTTTTPSAAGSAATVPGAAQLSAYNEKLSYDAVLGTLHQAVSRAGDCSMAIGSGAAVALSSAHGVVSRYTGALPEGSALRGDLTRCPLTVVDLPGLENTLPSHADHAELVAAATTRAAGLQRVDASIAALDAQLPRDGVLLVAGTGDDGWTPHLRVVIAHTAGADVPDLHDQLLTAGSTRVTGLVQLTDLVPTALAALDIQQPASMSGSVMSSTGGVPTASSFGATVGKLRGMDVGAQVIRDAQAPFLIALIIVPMATFALLAFLLGRQRGSARERTRRLLRLIATCSAAVPAATFLANLLPWWRASHPMPAMFGAVIGWTVVLALIASLGPWRRHHLGSVGVIATVTFGVIAIDVASGSHLQLNSLFGLSPLVAGRFYGIGNGAWAIYAIAALFTAVWAADEAFRREAPRSALFWALGIGCAAVFVDGWPGLGTDFGGMIGLIPAVGVLVLMLGGIRLSPARSALIVLATAFVVSLVAFLDWLRPVDQRTDLGDFVQQVLDGTAGAILERKLVSNLHTLDNVGALLAPLAYLVIVMALCGRPRARFAAIRREIRARPLLRPLLIACVIAECVGYAANDSGMQIPELALTTLLPFGVIVLSSRCQDGHSIPRQGGELLRRGGRPSRVDPAGTS
jgi:hypothetical protein